MRNNFCNYIVHLATMVIRLEKSLFKGFLSITKIKAISPLQITTSLKLLLLTIPSSGNLFCNIPAEQSFANQR